MPIVVCTGCGKALESDLRDEAGESMTPAHMAPGTAQWCSAEVLDPSGEHGTVDQRPDRRYSARERSPMDTMELGREAAARIDAALRERAERGERAFAGEIRRRLQLSRQQGVSGGSDPAGG